MIEEREYILSKDGLELCTMHWPVSNPKAVCCLVHGLGEHILRYQSLADFLNTHGVAVTGIDLRGHGKSKGKRGHAKSYNNLLSDVEELMKYTREIYNDTSLFLYGHSLGGNLVANYVKSEKNSELAGFILSSPFFAVSFEPPKWKIKLARLMQNIWPSLTQPTGLETNALSRIPEEVKKYENDPLVHDKISTSMYMAVSEMGAAVLVNNQSLTVDGLMFHGTADRLTSYKSTQLFHENNKEKVTFRSLEEGFHEPHNDICRDEVHEWISEFVLAKA